MIQAKDIRLGNYLKDREGKVLRVDFIEYVEHGFDVMFGQKMFLGEEEVDPMTEYSDFAEPIQINQEWLMKLGFIKQGESAAFAHYWLDPIWLTCISGGCLYLANKRHVEIYSVHQLQNLFYAITGTELEIK
jgi:hypothetical protein